MQLEFDLKDNAIDSLNEALAKYVQGQSGDHKAYKFCVLHFSHFIELMLKHYVTQSHKLLIYKKPFEPKFNDESQTIGLYEAINFLRNDGSAIDTRFFDDLNWLKKLRNKIEHSKFRMDLSEVKNTVGRLTHAVHVFSKTHKNTDLASLIHKDHYDVFNKLARIYEYDLEQALQKVKAAESEACKGVRHKHWGFVNFKVLTCDSCGNNTMITLDDSETGYRCMFCGGEDSEEIEVTCGVCGDEWPSGDMSLQNWSAENETIYVCPNCCDKCGQ